MNNLKETEKAYIAGLLDGEGCVGINKDKIKNTYKIRVIITNSNLEVIQWLKIKTGIGCSYKYKKAFKENWNPVHRWQIVSNQSKDFLNAIKKYSIIKKSIIEAVLNFPFDDIIRDKFTGRYLSREKEIIKNQEEYFQFIKQKNKRGLKIEV